MSSRRSDAVFTRLLRATLAGLLLVLTPLAGHAQGGELTIRIEEGVASALPIAIVPFAAVGDGNAASTSRRWCARISPLRTIRDHAARGHASQPALQRHQLQGLARGGHGKPRARQVLQGADGGFVVEFRVVDVYKGKQLMGYRIPTTENVCA